jgi:hypothetical protein
MKLRMQPAILVASIAALVLTFTRFPDQRPPPTPGTGPIFEPSPRMLRICAKELIIRAVIENRFSLPQAAALFREVNRMNPVSPNASATAGDEPMDGPPINEEELLCRNVIHYVRIRDQHPDLVARLEAELREWRRDGNSQLPDPVQLGELPISLQGQARHEWLAESRGIQFVRQPTARDIRCCE